MGKKDDGFKKWRDFHKENKNYFFNLGPENKWEKMLKEDLKKQIEYNFENEMKALKYI